MSAGMIGERWRWIVVAFLLGCLLIGLAREALAQQMQPLPSAEVRQPQPTGQGNESEKRDYSTEQSLTGIESLAGTFQQVIHDQNGVAVSSSSGEFAILRPHFLRWFVREPGEQLIQSDGEFLWQYDLDLETLTRQAVDTGQSSPLRLLIEPEAALASDYTVIREGSRIRLTPHSEQSGFESVELVFDAGVLEGMDLRDNLGQTIQITLAVDPEARLTPTDFEFTVPEGLEVVTRDH